MIFGRYREVKTRIPQGTFVVIFDDWPEGTPFDMKHIKGYVVEANSHEQANERAVEYERFVNRKMRRRLPR
jgi:hypothetical protein